MHEFDEGLDSFRSRSVLQKSWTNSVNASVVSTAAKVHLQKFWILLRFGRPDGRESASEHRFGRPHGVSLAREWLFGAPWQMNAFKITFFVIFGNFWRAQGFPKSSQNVENLPKKFKKIEIKKTHAFEHIFF